MEIKWVLVNAVFYDGSNAYVSKFVVKADEDKPFDKVSVESECKIADYLSGNGELLKIDILYDVNFDNILAFKDADDAELRCAYDRFKEIYF